MPAIFDHHIDHPAAWRSADIGGREGLTHRLSTAQIAAIGRLVAALDGRAPHSITRAEFDDPEVNALMAAARDAIMNGHGGIILSGLDVETWSLEDFERLYWGLGTHLGSGVMQSARGDHIGYVRREVGGPVRGYTTDMELRSHTDFHEILSLGSIRSAESGGWSGLVSALAIHNVMREERPDLLAALYEGHPQIDLRDGRPSPHNVPIFCAVNGKVSCFYSRVFMAGIREEGGIPERLGEAMACFDAIAARPEIRADFLLQPGELLFWHNFQLLHSRTAFIDGETHRRLLLRLWLNVADGRPMAEAIRERGRLMDAEHRRQFEGQA